MNDVNFNYPDDEYVIGGDIIPKECYIPLVPNESEITADSPQAEEQGSAACEPLLCAEPDGESDRA